MKRRMVADMHHMGLWWCTWVVTFVPEITDQ